MVAWTCTLDTLDLHSGLNPWLAFYSQRDARKRLAPGCYCSEWAAVLLVALVLLEFIDAKPPEKTNVMRRKPAVPRHLHFSRARHAPNFEPVAAEQLCILAKPGCNAGEGSGRRTCIKCGHWLGLGLGKVLLARLDDGSQ